MSNYNDSSSDIMKIKDDPNQKCAPSYQYEDGSCIPLEILLEMANAYNKTYKDKDQIVLHPNMETLNPDKYELYLIQEFDKRLKKVCSDQICWLKQDFIKQMRDKMKMATKEIFRPKGPDGQFTWLNTFDINKVMEQYQDKYKDFVYLGAVPIDFDDLPKLGIKNLDFNNLIKQGKTKIGIVYNLDEHDKPGSHWVASYFDLKKGGAYFYDSYGIQPEKRIQKLMRRIVIFMKEKLGVKPDVNYSRTRSQYKDSECGVYSIHFIHRMLKGDDFYEFTKNKIPDDKIHKYRKYYFI